MIFGVTKILKLTDRKIAKPKLITYRMFYDLEDPSKFIRDINLSLDDNGIFIAQLSLKSMLENDLEIFVMNI